MTLRLHVEHTVIGDKRVLETFEGVESFNDPPMTDSLHIIFEDDDKDTRKLTYGEVVRGVAE